MILPSAAWAHLHSATALCFQLAQPVALGAPPDRWHIGVHHEHWTVYLEDSWKLGETES